MTVADSGSRPQKSDSGYPTKRRTRHRVAPALQHEIKMEMLSQEVQEYCIESISRDTKTSLWNKGRG